MVNVSNLLGGGNRINIVINAVDNFSGTFKKVDKQTQKFNKRLSLLGKIAGVSLVGAAVGMKLLADESAKFLPVQNSFNRLVGPEAENALDTFRTSLKGTVNDFEIMSNANIFFQNISSATVDQFEQVAKAAGPLGRAVGITATEAFERLTKGIAKGETELLDELGLKLDATIANRKYAESIGKSVVELTAEERATAALNGVLLTLDDRLSRIAPLEDDLATKNEALAASWQNTKVVLGETFQPAVERSTVGLSGLVDATGELIKNNKLFIRSFTSVGLNLKALGGTFKLFGLGIKLTFIEINNILTQTFANIVNEIVKDINFLIKAFNRIPGVAIPLVPRFDASPFIEDTQAIFNEMQEVNAAIISIQKEAAGVGVELSQAFAPTESTFESIARQGGAGTATSANISSLQSLLNDNLEQIRILLTIGGRETQVSQLTEENKLLRSRIDEVREAERMQILQETNGGQPNVQVNIENLSGVDADQISQSMRDELSNLIR